MRCFGCRAQVVHDVGGGTVIVDNVGGTSDIVYLIDMKNAPKNMLDVIKRMLFVFRLSCCFNVVCYFKTTAQRCCLEAAAAGLMCIGLRHSLIESHSLFFVFFSDAIKVCLPEEIALHLWGGSPVVVDDVGGTTVIRCICQTSNRSLIHTHTDTNTLTHKQDEAGSLQKLRAEMLLGLVLLLLSILISPGKHRPMQFLRLN